MKNEPMLNQHEAPRSVLTMMAALMLALLPPAVICSQEKQEKTEEEMHAERSRKLFEAVHCAQSDPAAVRAFAGCWEVGAIWGPLRTRT